MGSIVKSRINDSGKYTKKQRVSRVKEYNLNKVEKQIEKEKDLNTLKIVLAVVVCVLLLATIVRFNWSTGEFYVPTLASLLDLLQNTPTFNFATLLPGNWGIFELLHQILNFALFISSNCINIIMYATTFLRFIFGI